MSQQDAEKIIVKEIPIPLVKANQIYFILGTATAFFLQSKYLVVFLFITAISSLLFGPQANVAFRISKPIFAHRLFYAPTESIELQRFNQMIVVICLGLSSTFFFFSLPRVGWICNGFVTVAASFALGGYCPGCKIYYPYKLWVNRARIAAPLLNPLFDFIAGTGIFKPPFQMKPQPLMLMGLAHESIRTALTEIQNLLKESDKINLLDLKIKINDLNRFISHHAKQEDFRMYPPIDKKSNGITFQFEEEHEEIGHLEHEIDRLINDDLFLTGSNTELFALLLKWCDYSAKHLRNEEAVLMPKIPRVLSYAESNEVLRSILDYNEQENINFHIEYAFKGLNPGQRYNYVNILKEACSEAQFKRYEAVLKPLVPEQAWAADFASGHKMV